MSRHGESNTDNWDEVRRQSEQVLGADLVAYIAEKRKSDQPQSELIGALHRVQGKFGFLGASQLDAVAQLLRVPSATVTGVATFYHYFRLERPGQIKIAVCMGTACYVRGAAAVADRIKEELGIEFGQTTTDGMFTLEAARCLGTCGLAPVVLVGEDMHGQVTPDHVPMLLEQYRQKAR